MSDPKATSMAGQRSCVTGNTGHGRRWSGLLAVSPMMMFVTLGCTDASKHDRRDDNECWLLHECISRRVPWEYGVRSACDKP